MYEKNYTNSRNSQNILVQVLLAFEQKSADSSDLASSNPDEDFPKIRIEKNNAHISIYPRTNSMASANKESRTCIIYCPITAIWNR